MLFLKKIRKKNKNKEALMRIVKLHWFILFMINKFGFIISISTIQTFHSYRGEISYHSRLFLWRTFRTAIIQFFYPKPIEIKCLLIIIFFKVLLVKNLEKGIKTPTISNESNFQSKHTKNAKPLIFSNFWLEENECKIETILCF